MEKIETPELEKIVEHRDESDIIGGFLEWLQDEQKIHLCEWGDYSGEEYEEDEQFYQINRTIEQLLAEYFEIDLDKAEKERVALLEQIRRD